VPGLHDALLERERCRTVVMKGRLHGSRARLSATVASPFNRIDGLLKIKSKLPKKKSPDSGGQEADAGHSPQSSSCRNCFF